MFQTVMKVIFTICLYYCSIVKNCNAAFLLPSSSLLTFSTRASTTTTVASSKFHHCTFRNTKQVTTSTLYETSNDSTSTSTSTSRKNNSIEEFSQNETQTSNNSFTFTSNNLLQILSASFLVTTNTVGPSLMVLPDLTRGPGLFCSTSLFLVIYIVNLISGLFIAEVAIKQYESSYCDVPSSFKEFADATLRSNLAGNIISSISIFRNWSVVSFAFIRSGDLLQKLLNYLNTNHILDLASIITTTSSSSNMVLNVAATFTAVTVALLLATQTDQILSVVASICCFVLFVSYFGYVIPSFTNVHDPLSTLMSQGQSIIGSDLFYSELSIAIPVIVSAMIYQNIVPSITKLLNYDRVKTVTAITLGSFIPMLMYIGYCLVVLGGTRDEFNASVVGIDGPFMAGISVSSLVGSTMACSMSLREEFESILFSKNNNLNEDGTECLVQEEPKGGKLLSILLATFPPLLAGIVLSGGKDFVNALSVSGAYATPVLYGFIPIVLAYKQRYGTPTSTIQGIDDTELSNMNNLQDLVPGKYIGFGILAIASISVLGQQFIHDFSFIINSLE